MTTRDWIDHAESRLASLEVAAAKLEAQMLAAKVLQVDRTYLFAHPEAPFPTVLGNELLNRRSAGEPLAYIVGWREFFGRPFGVDPSVLIPRHETETLVEAALQYRRAREAPISVLDMGAGSGIIAITLKLERPEWNLTGVDLSPEALATASANAQFHHASVRWILSNRFAGLLGEAFDLIVSNPPYIGRGETLPAEVVQHEPEIALFADCDGLEFYQALADQAPSHLHAGGALMVEIGFTQAKSVREIFRTRGWRELFLNNDLSGTPRVLGLTYEFDSADHAWHFEAI